MSANKTESNPGILGCIATFMLIVSFFLSKYLKGNVTVNAFNSIIIVIIMCLEIHLIRKTASMKHDHVWNSIPLSLLWLMPVFNLVVVAFQFFGGGASAIISGYIFTSVLIIFSLPVFTSLYFFYIAKNVNNEPVLRYTGIVMSVLTLIYLILRLIDKVIIPSGIIIGETALNVLGKISSLSSDFSLLTYLCALFGYIVFSHFLNKSENG